MAGTNLILLLQTSTVMDRTMSGLRWGVNFCRFYADVLYERAVAETIGKFYCIELLAYVFSTSQCSLYLSRLSSAVFVQTVIQKLSNTCIVLY